MSPLHSIVCATTLLAWCVAGQASQPGQEVTLTFTEPPTSSWHKQRLVAETLGDDSGVRVYDPTPDRGPFDDADLFRADTHAALPYGRKELSVRIEVGAAHRPLWQDKLLQFQVNGRELDAAVNADGEPTFVKDVGGDGKGFVPVRSGLYRFELDKALQEVQFISFMSAGADHFDVTLKDLRIEVWPEQDTRPRPYLLHYNRLGYTQDQRRWAVLEWQPDLDADTIPVTVRQTGGSEVVVPLERPAAAYAGSGRALRTIPLKDWNEPGFYTLIAPETAVRTQHTSAVFKLRATAEPYIEHRDLAWGAFHWFNSATYAGAHQQDARARVFGGDEQRDVRGGWYDAGDYGKYSVNGAWSVALPLLTWLIHPEALPQHITPLAERVEGRPAVLDVVKPELDFLLKMQRADGAVHHKVASAEWPALDEAPADDARVKTLMPVSTTATADFSAVMYMAAQAFSRSPAPLDQAIADRYRSAADAAYRFIDEHPERIMIEDRYDNVEYGGPYTDPDDRDERLWATVARHWHDRSPLSAATYERLLDLAGRERLGDAVPDWRHVNFLAMFNYLAMPHADPDRKDALLARIGEGFAALRRAQLNHPYGLMYAGEGEAFDWGSNGVIATVGTQLLWLHRLTGEPRWYDAAFDMSHWFFGLNPHGKIWTVGTSRYQVRHPHFRPMVSGAVDNPEGLLAGGPNSVGLKGDMAAQPLAGGAPMLVYVDDRESWATNEVAINWQAAWASYLSMLTAGPSGN